MEVPRKRPLQAPVLVLVAEGIRLKAPLRLVRKTTVANGLTYPNAASYNKTTKRGDFDPQSQCVGKGVTSGGSTKTPQVTLMKKGSGALHGSYPKSPQKLRG